MKPIFLSILVVFFLSGCASTPSPETSAQTTEKTHLSVSDSSDKKTAATAAPAAGAVHVQSSIPFESGAKIAANIKQECKLGKRLSDSINAFATKKGIDIVQQQQLNSDSSGKVLLVEITDAVSSGNAFIGHRKFASVKGTLFENGAKKASFTGTRVSGGGFFGGYMSSCAVLGRTTKAIGKDIVGWLSDPVDGAHLGDNFN